MALLYSCVFEWFTWNSSWASQGTMTEFEDDMNNLTDVIAFVDTEMKHALSLAADAGTETIDESSDT